MVEYTILYVFLWIIAIIFLRVFLERIITDCEISVNKIESNVKTGDVICFRSNDYTFLHDLVSPFTHIGIVIETINGKKILEMHDTNDLKHMGIYNTGVNMYDLKYRIKTYEGDVYLSQLKTTVDKKKIKNLLSKIEFLNKLKFDTNHKEHLIKKCMIKRGCKKCFKPEKKKLEYMFCSEFIGYILQELDVLEKEYDIACVLPGDFRFIIQNGNKLYKNIIKISL
jgi:hypothetical protein